MEDKLYEQPHNLMLLKVLDAGRDADGVYWHPVAGWALYPKDLSTGCPWHLRTIVRLALSCYAYGERYHPDDQSGQVVFGETEYQLDSWEVQALAAHCIAGMHDRYEHTFDTWERIHLADQMLINDWVIKEVAAMLECEIENTHQMLLYRTLYTRLPAPLLEYLVRGYSKLECPTENLYNHPDNAQALDYQGQFVPAAEAVSPFTIDMAGTIRMPAHLSPRVCTAMSRFLTFALTYNIMPWTDLYCEEKPGMLLLNRGALTRFRELLEADDSSGRIGMVTSGCNSDESLVYLLRARILNAVGPRGMWSAFGLWEPVNEEWHLPLHQHHRAGYELTDEEAEEDVWGY